MRLFLLLVVGCLVTLRAEGQERWRPLPGSAREFAVDLQSLALEQDVLRARVRTPDYGSFIVEEELEARCGPAQLRTVAQHRYDGDTGRPVPPSPEAERKQQDGRWVAYPPGSQGRALVAGLCRIARERKLLSDGQQARA